MYARLTTFRVKPDKIDEMRRWREENEAAIYAQPGLRQWISVADENGEVFVLALFDDERAARDTLPHAQAFWPQMAPMIEGQPTVRFLNVIAAENLAMRGAAMA
jgi:quinol monooxygenase YgiN